MLRIFCYLWKIYALERKFRAENGVLKWHIPNMHIYGCDLPPPPPPRLAPILFNLFISDMPGTTSSQHGYAGDLALLQSAKCWSKVEDTLTKDMTLIAEYLHDLKTWRLTLSVAKTTPTAFHLNSKEARRQLKVKLNGSPLPYNHGPRSMIQPNSNLRGCESRQAANLQTSPWVPSRKSVIQKITFCAA